MAVKKLIPSYTPKSLLQFTQVIEYCNYKLMNSKIESPTLILYGTIDQLVPKSSVKFVKKYSKNAEIIELHHNQKKDAPSGTAVKTALMMAKANEDFTKGNCPEKETIEGSRGGVAYNNIHIHSVRMPGYIASQEVIFGSSGQIFKIRHDSMDRKCYMGGVLMAVKHVNEKNDFIYGLENIMQ